MAVGRQWRRLEQTRPLLLYDVHFIKLGKRIVSEGSNNNKNKKRNALLPSSLLLILGDINKTN